MNLKKTLLISNFELIALPFLVAGIIGAGAIILMLDTHWAPIEDMFSDRNELVYAQSLIYSELDKLSDSEVTHDNRRQNAIDRLIRQMDDLGYHVQYSLNGDEKFNNITSEEQEKGDALIGPNRQDLDQITASQGNVHLIKAHWINAGNTVDIKAINSGKVGIGMNFSFFFTYIGFFLLMILTAFILTLGIVNTIIYNKTKKMILEPIQQISNAAKAIRAGNLDTPIDINGPDELEQVGQDFMDMQNFLKESVIKQNEYDMNRQELLSGISHDLRTPLTSIKGYTEGLMAGIADTPEKQRRYYAAIQTRTDDLEKLVNSLSLYMRVNRTLFMRNPMVLSFSHMLRSYVSKEKDQFERYHVTVEWCIDTADDIVNIDVTEFHRVLDNLFNNAVKYRTADTSYIRLRLEKESDMLVFLFSDDGPGIAEANLEHIFEAFVRLDEARSHTDMGSGLGLAIVKRIVKAHHGNVRAYNDRGLTLCITLPLYREREKD